MKGDAMGMLRGSEFQDEYQDWLENQAASGKKKTWLDRPVSELVGDDALILTPDTPIRLAINAMNERGAGAALIVERGEIRGIFTERDVLTRVVAHSMDIERTPVFEVMTLEPSVLPEWASLGQALRDMALGGYHHLPIVDARGRSKGLLAMRRVIESVCEAFPDHVLNAPPERQRDLKRKEGA
jgi:CBS domain-containing protein